MEKLPEQAVDPMLAKPTTDHNKPMARASLFGGNISPNTVAIKAIYPAVIKLTHSCTLIITIDLQIHLMFIIFVFLSWLQGTIIIHHYITVHNMSKHLQSANTQLTWKSDCLVFLTMYFLKKSAAIMIEKITIESVYYLHKDRKLFLYKSVIIIIWFSLY